MRNSGKFPDRKNQIRWKNLKGQVVQTGEIFNPLVHRTYLPAQTLRKIQDPLYRPQPNKIIQEFIRKINSLYRLEKTIVSLHELARRMGDSPQDYIDQDPHTLARITGRQNLLKVLTRKEKIFHELSLRYPLEACKTAVSLCGNYLEERYGIIPPGNVVENVESYTKLYKYTEYLFTHMVWPCASLEAHAMFSCPLEYNILAEKFKAAGYYFTLKHFVAFKNRYLKYIPEELFSKIQQSYARLSECTEPAEYLKEETLLCDIKNCLSSLNGLDSVPFYTLLPPKAYPLVSQIKDTDYWG